MPGDVPNELVLCGRRPGAEHLLRTEVPHVELAVVQPAEEIVNLHLAVSLSEVFDRTTASFLRGREMTPDK